MFNAVRNSVQYCMVLWPSLKRCSFPQTLPKYKKTKKKFNQNPKHGMFTFTYKTKCSYSVPKATQFTGKSMSGLQYINSHVHLQLRTSTFSFFQSRMRYPIMRLCVFRIKQDQKNLIWIETNRKTNPDNQCFKWDFKQYTFFLFVLLITALN